VRINKKGTDEMTEKNNEDTGLVHVKPETVKHGETTYGHCTWGQTKNGRWYSINYWPKHPMNERGFNAEVRWDIPTQDYDLYGIKIKPEEGPSYDYQEHRAEMGHGFIGKDGGPVN